MMCPCGGGAAYDVCCGPFHSGDAIAETAAQLMRSRYAAYATSNIKYLAETHDPDRRADFDALSAADWAKAADWKRLDILKTQAGKAGDTTGKVEFIAWFMMEGELACHHEVSDFRRLDDHRWVYTDGVGKPMDQVLSGFGRNEACPCGSGKKFKKCHGG